MIYPILSAVLTILAFNTSWYAIIFVSLVPLFLFFNQEKNFWRLLFGAALFRLIFALGSVYFVIDPVLYLLSILIFLGLPVFYYLISKYFSLELANYSLPILWTIWDYLEAQYTLLPMTLMMSGIPLADSAFLGLARFGGIIGLTFFVAFLNTLIVVLILKRHKEKMLFFLTTGLLGILIISVLLSVQFLKFNQKKYFSKKNFIEIELLSAKEIKSVPDYSLAVLSVSSRANLLVVAENFYKSSLDNYEEIIDFYKKIAKKLKVNISAISIRKENGKVYKSNLIFSASGKVLDSYDKNYLTITSEYWPFGDWRPRYFDFVRKVSPNRAIFDQNYQHTSGRPKILGTDKFSFASLICGEFHYPGYLNKLNQLRPDFLIHNSNNDWINFGLNQYLRLTNNLRTIEAVYLQKPILVNGIKDYAGIFYPDGNKMISYPKNGLSLMSVEVRY